MEITDVQWNDNILLKELGYIRLTRILYNLLIKSKNARIINIVGIQGKQPDPNFVLEGVINSSLLAFTKAISIDLAKYGATANAINPGATNTYLWENIVEELSQKNNQKKSDLNNHFKKQTGFNRLADPKDIANAVMFLASEETGYINGISINIDGGAFPGF